MAWPRCNCNQCYNHMTLACSDISKGTTKVGPKIDRKLFQVEGSLSIKIKKIPKLQIVIFLFIALKNLTKNTGVANTCIFKNRKLTPGLTSFAHCLQRMCPTIMDILLCRIRDYICQILLRRERMFYDAKLAR